MPTFQASSLSPPDVPHAGQNPAEILPGHPKPVRYVDVKDGGSGDWRVYADGSVKLLKGYPNVGQVYPPGSQVLSNLMESPPGNKAKIDEVMGTGSADTQLAKLPAAWSGGGAGSGRTEAPGGAAGGGRGGGGGTGGGGAATGWTDQTWFWPVVILGTSTLLAGGVLAYFYWSKPGQAQVKQLRRTGHYVPELAGV